MSKTTFVVGYLAGGGSVLAGAAFGARWEASLIGLLGGAILVLMIGSERKDAP